MKAKFLLVQKGSPCLRETFRTFIQVHSKKRASRDFRFFHRVYVLIPFFFFCNLVEAVSSRACAFVTVSIMETSRTLHRQPGGKKKIVFLGEGQEGSLTVQGHTWASGNGEHPQQAEECSVCGKVRPWPGMPPWPFDDVLGVRVLSVPNNIEENNALIDLKDNVFVSLHL